ncbi:MAG TPA: PqqD family peptide modification chaperone [Methanoregulaceae archaeon]|nr:PqqD family peptide modification chaperone [Methanoregulaceae archaeon]
MTEVTMDSVVAVTKDQMSCGLDDEAVILSIKKGVHFSLNPLGSRIWSMVQKPIKVGTIRDAILADFDIDNKTCEEDLLLIISEMQKEGLIKIITT